MGGIAEPTSKEAIGRVGIIRWSAATAGESYDVRSLYVERCWLGILGPSTLLLLRYVADRLELSPEGFVMDMEPTARMLGVGMRTGKNSPLRRSLGRAVAFGAARWVAPAARDGEADAADAEDDLSVLSCSPGPTDAVIAFKSRLPPVSSRQMQRIGRAAREMCHEEFP
jgi:hypothetical protein